jgi:hypothetical protein
MQITVLVEPTSGEMFRATTGEPLRLETEATTRDEAIRKLHDMLQRRMDTGAELVAVDVRSGSHPLSAFAGMLKDDPLLDAWREARAEYLAAKEAEGDSP